jgi:hypothetical protein
MTSWRYEANGRQGSGRVQTEIESSPGPESRRTLLEHIKNSSDRFRFWHETDMLVLSPHVCCWGMNGVRRETGKE